MQCGFQSETRTGQGAWQIMAAGPQKVACGEEMSLALMFGAKSGCQGMLRCQFHNFAKPDREFTWHLNQDFRCVVLPCMAEEKSRSKDIVLWIITVVLIALAIYWYKR